MKQMLIKYSGAQLCNAFMLSVVVLTNTMALLDLCEKRSSLNTFKEEYRHHSQVK